MSQIQQKPEPFNWAKYQRTYNNAIDLVAQMVGYNREKMLPIKAIILKPASHDLFCAGLKFLMAKAGQKYDELALLTFDGVEIKRGGGMQFESAIPEYYPINNKDLKN